MDFRFFARSLLIIIINEEENFCILSSSIGYLEWTLGTFLVFKKNHINPIFNHMTANDRYKNSQEIWADFVKNIEGDNFLGVTFRTLEPNFQN